MKNSYCAMCGAKAEAEHHLIFGASLRRLADEDGLTMDLCNKCHSLAIKQAERIHGNNRAEDLSKMLGQAIYERNKVAQGMTLQEAHEDFMCRYGRCYL